MMYVSNTIQTIQLAAQEFEVTPPPPQRYKDQWETGPRMTTEASVQFFEAKLTKSYCLRLLQLLQ